MEAELQQALLPKATIFRGLDSAVLSQLASIVQQHGINVKQAAVAFDKFMVTKRSDSTSVSLQDVLAFGSEYGKGGSKAQPLSAARPSHLFNSRISLEDMVMADVSPAPFGGSGIKSGGEGRGGDAAAGDQQQPAAAPSQRITPYLNRSSALKPHSPATGGKFAERQNAGSVLCSLNAHLELPQPGAAAAAADAMDVDGNGGSAAATTPQQQAAAHRSDAVGQAQGQSRGVDVEVLGQPLAEDAKYMVDRLEDKAAYLEHRILSLESDAEALVGLPPHPTSTAAQLPSLFVGRVCCDSEGGHLNPQSLLLEGSMATSAGCRVRLDVSKCGAAGYRLFPGQVVAVRGTNPSGHCIVASQLLPGLPALLPATPLPQLAAYAQGTGRGGQSVVAAAGPYTSSDDLEYAPLAALLDYCAQQTPPPHLLLLAGPFVDEQHPLVRGGLLDETFEDIYASRVLSQIRSFRDRTGGATRVLLLPSTRDVHHHPVLPQPALDAAPAAAAGATALANPATLRCNEVVVGCTSADWLMACTRQELAVQGSASGERLPALACQLAAQRSYFPLFPPPLDTPLDCSKGGAALALPCTPDLLLLPSELAPFAKLAPLPAYRTVPGAAEGEAGEVEAVPQGSVVCVNPGRLTKGASGGTFAHIHILPLSEALDVAAGAPPATNAPVPHQVDKRCRVEIKRI